FQPAVAAEQVFLIIASHPVLEDLAMPFILAAVGDRLKPELRALAPVGERRMGANPHANGGLLRRELDVPDIRDYAV
ncbi:hypothetical protein, partial [Rhizobium leguminosarum]|uniref:hypothetical protein n=1 Tax=Rhizobium leguminosarum TaxID=384 RepID=UPI003F9CCFE6